MVHLAITAIELTNHGPLSGTRRFELAHFQIDGGLAVYVRPNESGKTTLLESVAGVLWGETATSKSWSSSSQQPHWGAVEFVRSEADQQRRFRVQRNFQTHEVVAWELDGDVLPGEGGRQELFRGLHNPAGRTADHRRWPDHELPKLFTTISCDAFRHLAMLTQPLPPPEQLQGKLVQRLISGSRAGSADDAYEALVERFRSLSKLSKEAGISRVNARKDGRLDTLRAQRDQLQIGLDQTAGDLERAEEFRAQLLELDRQEKVLNEHRDRAEKSLQVITRHREVQRELDNAVDRAKELQRAAKAAHDAEQERAAADEQIAKFPEALAQIDPERLPELNDRLDKYRIDRASLEAPEQFAGRRAELRDRYEDVWDWPGDAAERIGPLQEATESGEDVREEVEELRRCLDRVQPQPDAGRRGKVAAVVGLPLAVAATLLVGSLSGWPLGVTVGVLAGIAAAATTYSLYQPQKEHPDYRQVVAELEAAQQRWRQAEQAVESARADVDWIDETNLTRLVQLGERRSTLQRRLEELDEQQQQQNRLRADLDPAKLPHPLPALLKGCHGNADKVTGQLDAFRDATHKRRRADDKIKTSLGPFKCQDRDELDARLQQWQDRRVRFRGELDLLAKEHALAEELQEMKGAAIDTRRRELQQIVGENDRQLKALEQRRHAVRRELGVAELGVKINVADAASQLQQIETEIGRLTGRCEAIEQAHRLLLEAAGRYSAHHREAIEGQINDLMAAWTGNSDRRFTVADDFALALTIENALINDAGGQPAQVELSVLSEGARDQLALAARMAVLDRVGVDVVLPILIDDAFLSWDSQRRTRLLAALKAAAGRRQFILVSHDRAFQSWGEPIVCRDDSA